MVMLEILLDEIEPHPANARTFPADDLEDPGLVDLAASIKALGLLEPIVVRPTADGPKAYQLLAGERRWRAMRFIEGAMTIAAVVRDVGNREALEILVTENLQRKDLSPIEEARGVRALVDQAGWTVADVADRLGRPLHWVAQRARLTSLSPAWQAEAADRKSGISRWPASLLVLVARLEPHVQNKILDEWGGDESPPARRDLERELAYLTRELRRAPWKLADGALYPDAGPCDACHKRSACHPGLFEDEDPQKPEKTDRCLDAICWKEKAGRHLAVREAELREKHKDLLLVNGQDASYPEERKGVLPWWGIETVKKTAPGALPALIVSGRSAGTVRWVAPPREESGRANSRPRAADGKPVPATLVQRRASLGRRRKAKAVELIKEAIGAIEPFPQTADAGTFFLAACVAVFGTKHQRNSSQWGGSFRYDGRPGLDRKPQGAWKLLAAMRDDLQKCCTELWHEVRLVLLERLAYQGTPTDIKKLWADAEAACEVLGIDAGACLRQAVEALPEPKSWAGLKADGTPKSAAPGKGNEKSKRKKAPKAKAVDEEFAGNAAGTEG
jgi:ParB/RepB/Spo0J family partition protein